MQVEAGVKRWAIGILRPVCGLALLLAEVQALQRGRGLGASRLDAVEARGWDQSEYSGVGVLLGLPVEMGTQSCCEWNI